MTKIVFLDFETFYNSKEYTLRKMTPIEYVLDRRFECLGVAVQEGNGEPYWVEPENIPNWIRKTLPGKVVVCHNALFDMLILAWRYGFVPDKMLDTLGMGRALLGYRLKSLGLDSLSRFLGFGDKGDVVAKEMSGIGLAQLRSMRGLHQRLKSYAMDDVNKCARIFYRLIKDFPVSEFEIMDMVLRCCIVPKFKLDRQTLTDHLAAVLEQKRIALELTGVTDASRLRSNNHFAELLEAVGVEPPMKISPTTGEQTYAFAKTDSAFIDLAEHEDPRVQALVSARLGHKSTLEETRTQRLITISNLSWPKGERWMPIPLGYGRAHTHRFGGDMKLNMQNLPRKSPLRKALVAPKGFTVVSIDLSQIEARIVAWLCEQLDLLEAFALGEDVYSSFAADVFGCEVSRKVRPDLRFIGKTAILGLGYSMSWRKFLLSLKSGSKKETGTAIVLSESDGQKIVNRYRNRYSKIADMWGTLGLIGIRTLVSDGLYMFGPCEIRKGEIILPNRLKLYYHNLHIHETSIKGLPANDQWIFDYGGAPKLLYGAKILENCTQALARIIVMELAIRASKSVGRFAHQVHDELIYVVRNAEVEAVRAELLQLAKIRPVWCPELPIAAEVKSGPSYGETK